MTTQALLIFLLLSQSPVSRTNELLRSGDLAEPAWATSYIATTSEAPRSPDGLMRTAHFTAGRLCYVVDLGPSQRPLSPAWWYPQGYAYWTIYAKGDVRLEAVDRFGWWMGAWPGTGVWVDEPPRVVSLTGLRDEAWRRHGLEIAQWAEGELLLCALAGSAYLWGNQVEAWGAAYVDSFPFGRACESPLAADCIGNVMCTSTDKAGCR